MRNDEREMLERLVHGVRTDLDKLLHPSNLEAVRGEIEGIVRRCQWALEREAAA